jgi:hypothetical protein
VSASTPNPKFLTVVSIAAGSAAEAIKAAFPCRLWGIAGRFKGTATRFSILQLADAAVTGTGVAVKITSTSGVDSPGFGGAAANGQGYAWFEDFFGMQFRNGITAAVTDAATQGGFDLFIERTG